MEKKTFPLRASVVSCFTFVTLNVVLGAQQWDCVTYICSNDSLYTDICVHELPCPDWIQYIFALLHWLYEQPSSVMRLVAFQVQQCLFIGQERLFVSGGSVARGLFFTERSSCTHKCPVADFCNNPSALQ